MRAGTDVKFGGQNFDKPRFSAYDRRASLLARPQLAPINVSTIDCNLAKTYAVTYDRFRSYR